MFTRVARYCVKRNGSGRWENKRSVCAGGVVLGRKCCSRSLSSRLTIDCHARQRQQSIFVGGREGVNVFSGAYVKGCTYRPAHSHESPQSNMDELEVLGTLTTNSDSVTFGLAVSPTKPLFSPCPTTSLSFPKRSGRLHWYPTATRLTLMFGTIDGDESYRVRAIT